MKLRVLDQIHISAVQADTLQPRQEIEVSDALGRELLDRHPDKLAEIPGEKAAPEPLNKKAPETPNKGGSRRRKAG